MRGCWCLWVFWISSFGLSIGAFAQSSPDLAAEISRLKQQITTLESKTLSCKAGKQVRGEVDRWSPWSTCPEGHVVTGLQRIDLLGDHNLPNAHVNDFVCEDRGCRAWCIGNPCTVEARCCR
jgi:hypothetical protein